MPEYRYKCNKCENDFFTELPISFNPEEKLDCVIQDCDGTSSRKFGFRHSENKNSIVVKNSKTLGDWYKKNTGKELLGG